MLCGWVPKIILNYLFIYQSLCVNIEWIGTQVDWNAKLKRLSQQWEHSFLTDRVQAAYSRHSWQLETDLSSDDVVYNVWVTWTIKSMVDDFVGAPNRQRPVTLGDSQRQKSDELSDIGIRVVLQSFCWTTKINNFIFVLWKKIIPT